MELIEQGRLYDAFTDTFGAMELITLESALGLIEDAPTIDAAPVVHGRWVWSPKYCKWICSGCGGREGECEAPICKWCGARMNGGDGHE